MPKQKHSNNPGDLKDLSVLLTRQTENNQRLSQNITQRGGHVLIMPLLEIEPLLDADGLRAVVERVRACSLCIYITKNAATLTVPYLGNTHTCVFATIGPSTAEYLQSLGINAVVCPATSPYDSQALLQALQIHNIKIAKQYIIIMTGADGDDWLQTKLLEHGAKVEVLHIYKRIMPVKAFDQFIKIFNPQTKIDIILITCITSLANLIHLAQVAQTPIYHLPLLVVSQRIYAYAITHGFSNVILAQGMTDDSILLALKNYRCTNAKNH